MAHKHRNPGFPTGFVLGGVAAAVGLVWWATRSTAAATTHAIVAQQGIDPRAYEGMGGMMPYAGDNQGRALTSSEAAAVGVDPMLNQFRENFARVNPQ